MFNKNQTLLLIRWIFPSAIEYVYYFAIVLVTAIAGNTQALRELLQLPDGFSPGISLLQSIENLLVTLVGAQAGAVLATFIYWALVGSIVYLFIWLSSNFSSELTNDLAVKRYVYPKNSDRYMPLKHFIGRTFFQMLCVFVLIFYINTLVQTLLPAWLDTYKNAVNGWPLEAGEYLTLALTILAQIAAMHLVILLLRLALLRKKIFHSE